MKKITALKQQKKNKDRVSVFLDDEYAFGVTMDAAMLLKKGQELNETEIAQLRDDDTYAKAFNHALRYLGFRARSQREMEKYLLGKEYSEEVIDATVVRLYEYNYLDDEEFARTWMRDRESLKPKGERALRYELRQKGVADEVISTVLIDLDEATSAWAAAETRLSRWKALDEFALKKKLMGFLGRRGFNYDAIRSVIEREMAIREGREID